MARIDSFLRLVVEQRASDLHFHAGTVPLIRHDGELVPLPFRALSGSETRKFLFELLTPQERERLEYDHELDMLYALPGVGRFRANVFLQSGGYGAAFRIIPDRPPDLEALGFPSSVRALTALQRGLVLIGGPTGSGKTTTLAAIVNEINKTARKHILTIEDPIEFLHEPIQSVVTQRQVGTHVDTFAEALRSAMREAPDVIVVGEMRDLETILLAAQAAETGTLVFGTLHTSSAARTLTRILDIAPEETRDALRASLSTLLRGVISQQLLKRASGDGRVAALEILLNTPAVAAMIRDNRVQQIDQHLQSQASPTSQESEMQSLDACLMRYVRDGLVETDEAVRVAQSPDAIRRYALHLQSEVAR